LEVSAGNEGDVVAVDVMHQIWFKFGSGADWTQQGGALR
jgi:hypothetical protein